MSSSPEVDQAKLLTTISDVVLDAPLVVDGITLMPGDTLRLSPNIALGYQAFTNLTTTSATLGDEIPFCSQASERAAYIIEKCWAYEMFGTRIPYRLFRLALLATQLFPDEGQQHFSLEYTNNRTPRLSLIYEGNNYFEAIKLDFEPDQCLIVAFREYSDPKPAVSESISWETLEYGGEEKLLEKLLELLWEPQPVSKLINTRAYSIVDQFCVEHLHEKITFGTFFMTALIYSSLDPSWRQHLELITSSDEDFLRLRDHRDYIRDHSWVTIKPDEIFVETRAGPLIGRIYTALDPYKHPYDKATCAALELTNVMAKAQ